jgi:hypothetical protein
VRLKVTLMKEQMDDKAIGIFTTARSWSCVSKEVTVITFWREEDGVADDDAESLRGVAVPPPLAEGFGSSESVSETSSAAARVLEVSSFFIVILGRESAGKGKDGISDNTADGEDCGSGLKAFGDRWAESVGEAAGTGVLTGGVLSVERTSAALERVAALFPWLRSFTTPCSSAADLLGNLNGEGESTAAFEPSRSGLPSFIFCACNEAEQIVSGVRQSSSIENVSNWSTSAAASRGAPINIHQRSTGSGSTKVGKGRRPRSAMQRMRMGGTRIAFSVFQRVL